MPKSKHLTLDERYTIQHMLSAGESFKAISRKLNRDCTTISKEVKARKVSKRSGCMGKSFNNCLLRNDCNHSKTCNNPRCRKKFCRFCGKCIEYCHDYTPEVCSKLLKPPYVCNGCDHHRRCTLERSFYKALSAQKQYEELLSSSRSGYNITEEELQRLDNLISPLILKGQSIHHICSNNKDLIMHSERAIYNFIDNGLLSAKNLDLPKKVRFRPRKNITTSFKVDKRCRVGRNYDDFLEYISLHSETPIVQMDSVIGIKGGKTLLTLHFVNTHFMLAFLRDDNTARSVSEIFFDLYLQLTPAKFIELFPLILTDNGSEFSNPNSIEFDMQGNQRTKVFYCDPYAPQQRGAGEVNHEFIRRILPKGTSFNNLTQNDVNKMMNHINSYGREKLNDRPPHQLFSLLYGEEVMKKLACELINPNDITLLPTLLK